MKGTGYSSFRKLGCTSQNSFYLLQEGRIRSATKQAAILTAENLAKAKGNQPTVQLTRLDEQPHAKKTPAASRPAQKKPDASKKPDDEDKGDDGNPLRVLLRRISGVSSASEGSSTPVTQKVRLISIKIQYLLVEYFEYKYKFIVFYVIFMILFFRNVHLKQC